MIENPLCTSPFIMKPNPVSAVNARLVVKTYMSFPVALSGPFNEKEVMDREEEENDNGTFPHIQINSTPLSIIPTGTRCERGGSNLKSLICGGCVFDSPSFRG
jgi:hypothetical protein